MINTLLVDRTAATEVKLASVSIAEMKSGMPVVGNLVERRYKVILGAIICLALALRWFAVFVLRTDWSAGDSPYYFQMADAILNGHPIHWLPNGYPLMIAGIKLICGEHAVVAMKFINVVLSTAVVGISYLVARKLMPLKEALLACLLVGLYPNQIYYAARLLSETPTVFLLVFASWLFLERRYQLSGWALGLTCLLRSTMAPVIVLNGMLLAWERRSLADVGLFLIGPLCLLAANAFLEHEGIVGRPTNLGYNLVISTHISHFSEKSPLPESELARPVRTYVHFAVSQPVQFARDRLNSLVTLWGPYARDADSPIKRVLGGIRFPFFILATLGLFLAVKRKLARDRVCLLYAPILIITAVYSMFFSVARFTCPVEPFLIVLSCWAMLQVHRSWWNCQGART